MKKIIIAILISYSSFAQLSPALSNVYLETSIVNGSNKGVTSDALFDAVTPASSIHRILNSYGGAGESVDALVDDGIYLLSTASTGTKPAFTARVFEVLKPSGTFVTQIAYQNSGTRTAYRSSQDTGATWSAWREFQLLSGYTSGAGTISSADNVLEAIQKLNGNDGLKANLASPALTGTPTAPTATAGTNTTQVATTAFVTGAIATAKPYKVYTALLSQTGTSAPVATVLQNTLGYAITWSRSSTGIYIGTLSAGGNFPTGKVFRSISKEFFDGSCNIGSDSATTVQINSVLTAGTLVDGKMLETAVEIRVYP